MGSSLKFSEGMGQSAAVLGIGIAGKVEGLRSFLQKQTSTPEFKDAYEIVRSSGDLGAEYVKRKVSEVIGAAKVDALLPMFQLLVFLEVVAYDMGSEVGAPDLGSANPV